MAEYIGCRKCDSRDCKGCNIKKLETMLNNGKFDRLMNGNRCINPFAYVAPVQEWISVKDRLPDACGYPCLLCGENKFGQICVFEGFTGYMECGKFEWHSNQKDIDIDVWTITHWMPLPEPPKGE